MTLRQYLIVMIVGTALSWIAWGLVIANVDPFYASPGAFFFFYSSLFLASLGTLALVVFAVRRWFARESHPLFRTVQRSFHEACIIAALFVVLLALRGASLLRLWNFLAFLTALVVFFLFRWNARRESQTLKQESV